MESSKRMWGGREFQSLGAAWEKAPAPIVLSLIEELGPVQSSPNTSPTLTPNTHKAEAFMDPAKQWGDESQRQS